MKAFVVVRNVRCTDLQQGVLHFLSRFCLPRGFSKDVLITLFVNILKAHLQQLAA
jgi:hypothetical protein